MIKMELKFSKKDTLKLIEEYYKKTEGRMVKANISSHKVNCGYGRDEYDTVSSTLTISEEFTSIGATVKSTTTISDTELKNIFNNILEENSYGVEKFSFDDGLNYETIGAYMYEQSIKTPYCNGIILKIKSLGIQKSLGGK